MSERHSERQVVKAGFTVIETEFCEVAFRIFLEPLTDESPIWNFTIHSASHTSKIRIYESQLQVLADLFQNAATDAAQLDRRLMYDHKDKGS